MTTDATVRTLINQFEQLTETMDSNRTSKLFFGKKTRSVGLSLNEFTEIKRPPGKNKVITEEKCQTLPRNFKETKDSTKEAFTRNTKLRQSKDRREYAKRFSAYSNEVRNNIEDKLKRLQEETLEIEKKVESFGDSLRQKRNNPETASNLTIDDLNLEDLTETSENTSSSSVSEEVEDYDSDDMFGLNSFDSNFESYIVESYNDEGRELIKTFLKISHHEDDCSQELIQNHDYVVYKNFNSSVESGLSKNSTEKIDFSLNNPTYLYTKFSEDNPKEEHLIYDDDNQNEEDTQFVNYLRKRIEDNKGYYENIGRNFSTIDNVVKMQVDGKRTKEKDLNKKIQLQYIIEEIIKTEEQYNNGLKKVVDKYIPYIQKKTPQDLIGRTSYLFGNIEDIYKNSKSFLHLLKKCGDDYNSIAQIFIDSASEFELYPLYSKNKPTADVYLKEFDVIIKERQRQLNDKLGLSSYLLTPIQRLGKYVLLLQNMEKELKKSNQNSEKIASAITVVQNVMRKGNDYIAIDSIKNSSIDLNDKGSFIMRSLFTIQKPKKFVSMVFLFENIVVFTEKTAKNLEYFKYLDSISMSDLSMGKCEDKPTVFFLINYSKTKKKQDDASYVLEAETPKIKDEWTDTIEKILWSQLKKVKAQQEKLGASDNKHTAKVLTTPKNTVAKRHKAYRSNSKIKSTFYDVGEI